MIQSEYPESIGYVLTAELPQNTFRRINYPENMVPPINYSTALYLSSFTRRFHNSFRFRFSSGASPFARVSSFSSFECLGFAFRHFVKISSNNYNADFKLSPINDADEILETHYIPGKYLHFVKKNKRQLKREAREASYSGSEPISRISARKSECLKNEGETQIINDEDFSTTLSHTQRNLAQRLNRAIIKCNDRVPHVYLTSTFMKIIDITISPDSKFARIWWKPEGQKGISKAAIEQQLRIHLAQYRSMLQRSMHVHKPPKILFCREDLQLGDINKILDQIEAETKMT